MTEFDDFLQTLKKAAAALREADVPFLLGGGWPPGPVAGLRAITTSILW